MRDLPKFHIETETLKKALNKKAQEQHEGPFIDEGEEEYQASLRNPIKKEERIKIRNCINNIKEDPEFYTHCPLDLIDLPEIKELVKTVVIPYWINILKENPDSSARFPWDLKELPEIKELIKTVVIPWWINHIKQRPTDYKWCPLALKYLPEIKEIVIPFWAYQLKSHPEFLDDEREFPSELRREPEILKAYRQGLDAKKIREKAMRDLPKFH